MRRSLVVAVALAVLVAPAAAVADSPHFVSLSASVSSDSLTASFKVGGLGNGTFVVTLTDDVNFTCQTKGSGQVTSANEKVLVTKSFTTHNGQFQGSVTFQADCPGTQIASNAVFVNVFIEILDSSGNVLLRQQITDASGNLLV